MILNRKFLKFEIDLDFVLIAVTTSLKDYRICYLINKSLNFNFIKMPDLSVDILPGSRLFYSHFTIIIGKPPKLTSFLSPIKAPMAT